MTGFTVDTHLFRELGQLLVGRDSTALVELVKNAYDADATLVAVHGDHLDDPGRGAIRIQDNGVGMTSDQFEKGFLRIASRFKDAGSRLSPEFERRYTGAKGIGRLAAHKLAKYVDIESIPWIKGRPTSTELVVARINWELIESRETLENLPAEAVQLERRHLPRPASHGTTIVLSGLRQKWTRAQLGTFLTEIDTFQPPSILTSSLPKGLLRGASLFESPQIKRTGTKDPGFNVNLEGAFATGDSYWPAIAQSASWLLEIKADAEGIHYGIYPLKNVRDELPGVEKREYSEPHPNPAGGPFFEARVLVREGPGEGDDATRGWAKRVAGVRVFMEGFRVLPYGETGDDWLEVERDNSDRFRRLRFLPSRFDSMLPPAENEGLVLLPRKHYFGAVFLTQERAPGLSMLVNREGFVPNVDFEHLRTTVRRGIDLLTRVRASVHRHARDVASAAPRKERKLEVESAFAELQSGAQELRALGSALPGADARRVSAAVSRIERAAQLHKEYVSSEGMTRVLASVGLQLAAFTHEMNAVLGMAHTVESTILRIRDRAGLPTQTRAELGRLASGVAELRRAIERQAAHLTDVVTPDARRRRTRHKLAERFGAARRFVDRIVETRGIEVRVDLDEQIRSPPMFASELTTIFTNLLTNAVKAAGEKGRIRISADQKPDGVVVVRIDNTGTVVDLDDAERWFRPFESTTSNPDPVLGQGMGLGLTITRDMLSEIGGTIEFVSPRKGFSTAVQITFPK